MLAALFDEPTVLFKEKINYKHPGGGGFAPHQDATAYRFVDHHISCMVPLDPATPASGCLYVAPGFRGGPAPDRRAWPHRGIDRRATRLAAGAVGAGRPAVLRLVHTAPQRHEHHRPGAAGPLPHLQRGVARRPPRSLLRRQARRVRRAGDDFDGERVRISISDDFLGRPVSGDTHALDPLDPLLRGLPVPIANEMYDETVTELEHALQTAALARAEETPELIAASLLHDVGHLVVDDVTPNGVERVEDRRHEAAGANFLSRWFGPRSRPRSRCTCAAKRYLCAVDAGYLSELSPASVRSLHLQGGPMTEAEIVNFQRNVHHRAAVQLRRWDDRAKVPGLAVPAFEEYPGPAPLADERRKPVRSAPIAQGRQIQPGGDSLAASNSATASLSRASTSSTSAWAAPS